MRRIFYIPLFTIGSLLTVAQTSLEEFRGMKSREILEKIRNDLHPKSPNSAEVIRQTVCNYAAMTDGQYRDYFSASGPSSFSDLIMLKVVPEDWWPNGEGDISIAAGDLHNILPANKAVIGNRYDYPPGIVTLSSYDNSYWKAGIGEIAGMETNFYEPADEVKGDIARIYMYVAAVYARPLWGGRAPMLFTDGYYPLLTAYGRELLLDWHRADPVDETEARRNSVIAEAQGFGNPFVEDPALAEYVWGKHSDETYGDTPKDDDPPSEDPIMLKAVYSITRDGRIDFRSPYVDSESVWTFNSKEVSGSSISLANIAPGRYEITFTNSRSRGKLLITIEP